MKLYRVMAAGIAALSATAGYAENINNETEAPAIVVTASRTGRTTDEIAAGSTVITGAQLENSGVSDIAQALQKLGGIHIRRTSGNPSRAEIALRGFGENSHGRTLVLVNGERLNNLDMSVPDLLRVPFNSIDRIEILRGPQTILHGDYASAGVINIVTRQGSETPSTTLRANAGSHHTRGGSISTTGPLGDNASYAVDGNWQSSDGWRRNSDFETRDIRGTVNADWNDRFNSSFSVFYNDTDYGMPGALSLEQMQENPRQTLMPNDNFKSDSWGVFAGNTLLLENDIRLTLDLGASRRETNSRNDYSSWGYWMFYDGTLDSYAVSPALASRFQVAGLENRLTAGFDARYDRLTMAYSYAPQMPLMGIIDKTFDLNRLSTAVYAENETFFTDDLSILLGGRLDRISTKPDVNDTSLNRVNSTENALSAALLYRPTKEIKLFARSVSFYHAPFADEQINIWGFPPSVASLEPETGIAWEIGTAVRIGSEWDFSLTAFQSNMKREIVYNPTTFSNENYDDTKRRGFETSLLWAFSDRAQVSMSYSFVDAEFDAGNFKGNSVPLAPRHNFSINSEWQLLDCMALLASLHAVGSQYHGSDFSNSQSELNSYGIADLGVRITPQSLPGLSLTAIVDNIMDKDYATTGFYGNSFYPADGRTWRLNAAYSF